MHDVECNMDRVVGCGICSLSVAGRRSQRMQRRSLFMSLCVVVSIWVLSWYVYKLRGAEWCLLHSAASVVPQDRCANKAGCLW